MQEKIQAAQAAGYRVHQGSAEDGRLEGQWWWTLCFEGKGDVETSPDDFESEAAAWLGAVRAYEGEPQSA